jgi:predicted alpha/beta superfamily hydrolase
MSEQTIEGTVHVLDQVYSPHLDNQRDILVYLPPEYDRSAARFPVIYMHDGQNLFNQAYPLQDRSLVLLCQPFPLQEEQ